MPKNPDSPPWETNRDITEVNKQDLDYVRSKADGEFSEFLVDLFLEGETTVTESMAKGNFPLESEAIIKKVFLILVQTGRLTGPEGRQRTFTISDTVWASEKAKEKKEQEILKKARIAAAFEVEQEEEEDDDEEENEDGDVDEDDEEEKGAGSKPVKKEKKKKPKKRALQDASNILTEIDNDGGSNGFNGVSAFSKKNRRKIDVDRSAPAIDDGTAAVLDIQLQKEKAADLVGILKAEPAAGLGENLIHDVNEQLTITLQGADDGIPVSVAQSQCAETNISSEDFFKVLQWKHDQNHIFVDGDIRDPSSTIYPM